MGATSGLEWKKDDQLGDDGDLPTGHLKRNRNKRGI